LVLRGHNNFCSTLEYLQSKIGGMTAPFAPPGYASDNSYWWLCGFEPFVAITNP